MIVWSCWKRAAWLTLALAFVATSAMAATAVAIDVTSAADFGAKRAEIEQALAGGETYAEISPDGRSRALTLLSEMAGLIEQAGSGETLAPVQQVELFNRQEELNQILARAADDSRLVCRRARSTGSKLAAKSCQTVAERRRARDGD